MAQHQAQAQRLHDQISSLSSDVGSAAVCRALAAGILDLHFLRRREALGAVAFVLTSGKYQRKGLLVVTGRGVHSKDNVPVLRPLIREWLVAHSFRFVSLSSGGAFQVRLC